MKRKNRRGQISSDEQDNRNYQFSEDDPVQHNRNEQKYPRAKRNSLMQRNYQQDFSENQDGSESTPGEFIYFKGGRVSKILAERIRKGAKQVQRLCKFHSKSYLHVEWLTQKQIQVRNIQMLRTTKRMIDSSQHKLAQIQQKFGQQHFFNPAYVKVDRILTAAVLFPIMHHKKGSQMNNKWSQMLMLVCSKILNFEKDSVAYGILEKDDFNLMNVDQGKMQNKIKLEHVINRVYLDKYSFSQQFWIDLGQCVRTLSQLFFQTGRQKDAQLIQQCAIFLYWQWFSLSKQRFLAFLPKSQKYEKVKNDLENQNPKINFTFSESDNFRFEDLIKENIFAHENYRYVANSQDDQQRHLSLLHPGKFSYAWLNGGNNNKDYTQTIFVHLNSLDIKKLDLNIQIDPLYLIKWSDLDYDQVTWEKQSDLNCYQKIQNFKQYTKIPPKRDRQRIQENKKYHKVILTGVDDKGHQNPQLVEKCRRRLYHYGQTNKEIKQYGGQDIPVYKGYKILKSFQLQGLNWLIKSWHERRNCILADQMGLGKTIQTIAFLNHLHVFENVLGPFLIVAPVSTLKQWRNQIQQWSDLNCVLYKGKIEARSLIQQYQFYHQFVTNEGVFVKFQRLPRFQVLLTNYEIFVSDIEMFQKLAFQHIILDEAHKMKNSKSKIATTLRKLPCSRMLLLTGTPIQNNTSELYGLLNVIQPKKFNSLDYFKQKFGNLKTAEQLAELKEVLKPYLMRRVKSDVQKSIPKLSQMIVTLQLTKIQKAFYRGILEKNKNQLLSSLSSTAINNVSLCLRQCCNHPYMLSEQAEDDITSTCQTDEQRFDKFINASSKMIFVHKFLTKCRVNRSKTLIFTQFLEMMRLLKEYCLQQKIQFQSLDGSVNYEQRQNRIDRFNSNPDVLVFIISTKAGGIGINLTSATNIIIYDSDWNPQNDIQAIARAHRIGQHKNVSVFRLITTQTYEDILYKSAVKKLGIGLAILDNQYFNNQTNNSQLDTRKEKSKQEIQKLLRDGVLGFLKSEDSKEERSSIENQSIQDIISKSCTTVDYQTKDCSFTQTKFSYQEEKDNNINIDDPNFWEVALENVESPLQKLVKKLKDNQNAKKIFEDPDEQLQLMIQANQVVFNFVKSKVSMSHFNAQDERELRIFLEKITFAREFIKQFKNIANDWLEEIQKPSRRFEKCEISYLNSLVKNRGDLNSRPARNRTRNTQNEDSSLERQKQKQVRKKKKKNSRVIQSSSQSSSSSSNEEKEDQSSSSKQEKKEIKIKNTSRNNKSSKGAKAHKQNNSQQSGKDQEPEPEPEPEKRNRINRLNYKDQKQLKKQINENLSYFLEKICFYCERKVCSKICKGRCRRNFHSICYERYKTNSSQITATSEIQQPKLSKQQLSDSLSDSFKCFECVLGIAKCFICGQSGTAIPSIWAEKGAPKKPLRYSDDPSSKNQINIIYQRSTTEEKQAVFQCRMEYCTKVYHLKCLKDTKKQLQFQMYCNKQQKSYPLKCPSHFCSSCNKMLNISKVSCLRCPVSYHVKCKSSKANSLYQIDNEWFICKSHMGDQELEKRNEEKKDAERPTMSSKRDKMQQKRFNKQVMAIKEKLRQETKEGDEKLWQANKSKQILNPLADSFKKEIAQGTGKTVD